MGVNEILIGCVGSLLAAILWDELKAWAPRLSHLITRAALRLAPPDLRPRLAEEWDAHVADTPGHLGKLTVAAGFLLAARGISKDAKRSSRGLTKLAPPLRLMDVALSAGILILIAPLMILTIIALKIESGGPVLFAKPRRGAAGKPIQLYAFRTFTVVDGKARISRVGRFVRRTSLDELPQLINVLKGDMSMVGPRPRPGTQCATSGDLPVPGIVPPELLGITGPLNLRKYVRALLRTIIFIFRN